MASDIEALRKWSKLDMDTKKRLLESVNLLLGVFSLKVFNSCPLSGIT